MTGFGLNDEQSLICKRLIQDALGTAEFGVQEKLQSLWGGQGQIVRLHTGSLQHPTVILKQITLNRRAQHPRGWNTDASFQRKARSYEVENHWYEHYAHRCGDGCRVARHLGAFVSESQRLILLEDLSVDYPQLRSTLTLEEVRLCLRWLAQFHAKFMQDPGTGLWPEGSYWHLATRQEEYAAMADSDIKRSAVALDQKLRGASWQCLIHGDAKVANFCFNADMTQVAAVDFQYIGRGCGMKDVVYLLGSCLAESDCEHFEEELLEFYFRQLQAAGSVSILQGDFQALETQWRGLYAVAWTDFYRFLLGWMPTHQKINTYTRQLAAQALSGL